MTQEFIRLVRNNLKGLTPEKQEIILAELMSYIESGEDDLTLGENREERIKNSWLN